MDYNTAMNQFKEDLERAIHSGNKERIEAIKCEINSLKRSRLEWFHNGFYDYKTGEWHTMTPDEAAYLATCGMSDEEIAEYVSSREEYARKLNQSLGKYESMKKNTSDLIYRQDAISWLLEKGQKSERYKLGETWELNFDEIKDALSKVPEASPFGGYNPFPGYKFDKNSESKFEVGMAKEPLNIAEMDIPSIHPGMDEIGSDAVKELYHDPVNHPSHYTQGGIECIEAIEAACTGLTGLEGYLVGQVIKYIWRWKHKNGLQDLEKAKWYLERLITNIKKTT